MPLFKKNEKDFSLREKDSKNVINKDAIEKRRKEIEDLIPNESWDSEAYISLRHIDKIYDNGIQAVSDFNLDIKKGEFIVIFGPSGCGKTTMLRMVAGLENITNGKLYINGEYNNDKKQEERNVTIFSQNHVVYPHMSVYENIAYGLKNIHLSKTEIDQRVRSTAKTLQIEECLDKKPNVLSSGQRERLALGRSIVRNTKIILMDEPFSSLDSKLRIQMRSEIIKLHETLKTTIIYATSDPIEAMMLASRIVVMKLGHIQQIGSPIEIYNKPMNTFVASLIGMPTMNLIKTHYENHILTLSSGEKIALPAEVVASIKEFYGNEEERDITLGIRPEDIYQENEENIAKYGDNAIDIKVADTELFGNYHYIHSDFGGIDFVIKVTSAREIKIGDDVNVHIDMTKIHLFDVDSGNRVY